MKIFLQTMALILIMVNAATAADLTGKVVSVHDGDVRREDA